MLCWTRTSHMLNQVWWTHLAIVNMSHRKRVRTLESFFAPNRSQSESEKNDTEQEQGINQEETDEDWRNRKNHKITRGCAMKRRRCSAIFVGNLRRQTPLHQQRGVQIVPQWWNPSSNPASFLLFLFLTSINNSTCNSKLAVQLNQHKRVYPFGQREKAKVMDLLVGGTNNFYG